MSLEKSIYHKKEYRKQYHDSRNYDWSCRNHKSCNYCKENRLFFDLKKRFDADEEIEEFEKGELN